MVTQQNTLTPKQIAMAQRHATLRARPCRDCGRPVNTLDKRQVKCGLRCPAFEAGNKLVDVACCVCKKVVKKLSSQVRQFNCCSLKCQRVWAGKCGADWSSKSKEARVRFRRQSSDMRKGSVRHNWWRRCKDQAGLLGQAEKSQWERKCTTAAMTLKKRIIGNKPTPCVKLTTWNLTFQTAMQLLKSRQSARSRTGWDARCTSAARGIKNRILD